jgi:uncharacterized Zn-finger protein
MNSQKNCFLCGNSIKISSGNSMICNNCFKNLEAGTAESIKRIEPNPKKNNLDVELSSSNNSLLNLLFRYIGTIGGLLTILVPPIVFIMSLNAGKSFKDSFIFAVIIFGFLVFRTILAWLRYK